MRFHHARTAGAVVIAAATGAFVAPAPSAGAGTVPITVSPAAATPGSTVTVSGSGCLPGPVLSLLDKVVVNVAGVASVNGTVNADGTWSVPVVVPAVGPTALKVSATCLADGLLGSVLNYTGGLLNVVTNVVGNPSVTVDVTLPGGGQVDASVGVSVPTTWDMHDDMVETTPKVETGDDTDTPTNGTSKVGAAGSNGGTGATGAAGTGGAGGAGATGATGATGAAGATGDGSSAAATATDEAAAPAGTDTSAPMELASVDCTGDDCPATTDDGTSWWAWALGGIAAACLATAGVAAIRRRRTGVPTGAARPRHEHSRSRP